MLVEANSKAFPLGEEALRKWAKREGIFLHPEAAFLVKTQTMGMGVFAKRGIGKGQTVISCPHTAYIAPMDEKVDNAPAAAAIANYRFNTAAVLSAAAAEEKKKVEETAKTAEDEEKKEEVPSAEASAAAAAPQATTVAVGGEDRLDDWTRTVLRLMAEVLRADSPWRSWLQCCPRMPDSLFAVPLPSAIIASSSSSSSSSSSALTSSTQQQQEVLFGLPDFLRSAAATNVPSTAIITGPAQQLQDLSIEKKWRLVKPLLDANPQIWPTKIPAHCNPLPLSPAQQAAAAKAAAAAAAAAANNANAITTTPPPPPPRITCLKDLFLECAAQVTSRNFHRESQDRPGPYLLPTVDFLNHSAERKNVDFQIHGGGGGKRHVTFDVIATRDILPKEQIFHDYGALSAARFLVEFQFVLHPKALEKDEGLRWSKEALSTLVALLYCNGNSTNTSASNVMTFEQKYNQCLARCTYLIRNDLFLFEEGIIFSGGTNEAVGGGGDGAGGMASAGSASSGGAADLKAAAVIDYASGKAVVSSAASSSANGGAPVFGVFSNSSGQEARSQAAKRAERKRLEMAYLHNTLFLLSISDVCFDCLKPFLSRHWTVMDMAINRREYESTGAGQRVLVELGCPLTPKINVNTSAASASAAVAVAPVAAGPQPTNANALIADNLTLEKVPFFGAFSTTSFRVGPTVLKEISNEKLAVIVASTLTLPFVKAYEAVVGYQLGLLEGGGSSPSSSAAAEKDGEAQKNTAADAPLSPPLSPAVVKAFPTPRTAEMTRQVLAHEYGLAKGLEKDIAEALAEAAASGY